MAPDLRRKIDSRVPHARKLRHEMTDAERKLWRYLRALKTEQSHFRRQATIGPYFVDFACHEQKLVVEVDGGQHNEAPHIASDAQRTAFLEAQGYRVLRFWNNEVLQSIEGVIGAITDALANSKSPHP